jgi:hypothetical protein
VSPEGAVAEVASGLDHASLAVKHGVMVVGDVGMVTTSTDGGEAGGLPVEEGNGSGIGLWISG